MPVHGVSTTRATTPGPSHDRPFQAGHIAKLARIVRVLCAVAGSWHLPLADAVAVSRGRRNRVDCDQGMCVVRRPHPTAGTVCGTVTVAIRDEMFTVDFAGSAGTATDR
jgi:hypothetical protein